MNRVPTACFAARFKAFPTCVSACPHNARRLPGRVRRFSRSYDWTSFLYKGVLCFGASGAFHRPRGRRRLGHTKLRRRFRFAPSEAATRSVCLRCCGGALEALVLRSTQVVIAPLLRHRELLSCLLRYDSGKTKTFQCVLLPWLRSQPFSLCSAARLCSFAGPPPMPWLPAPRTFAGSLGPSSRAEAIAPWRPCPGCLRRSWRD